MQDKNTKNKNFIIFKHNPKYLIYNDGRVYSKNVNRFMKPIMSNGYLALTLVHQFVENNKNVKKKRLKRIHRIVANHFVHNNDPVKNNIVDHIDCNKLNNHHTNLRWVTSKENTIHALNNGVKSGNIRKVTIYDKNRNIIGVYENVSEAERKTGISTRTIYKSNKLRCIVSSKNKKYYCEYSKEKKQIKTPNGKHIPNFSDNYIVTSNGKIYSKFKKNYLNISKNRDGYERISLKHKSLKKCFFVHRLVAILFIPNNNNTKNQVNHIDGNKLNNCIENLEWTTSSENNLHKITLHAHLSRPIQKLDKDSLEVLKTYKSIANAAKDNNVHFTTVGNCVRGIKRTAAGFKWKYVDEDIRPYIRNN